MQGWSLFLMPLTAVNDVARCQAVEQWNRAHVGQKADFLPGIICQLAFALSHKPLCGLNVSECFSLMLVQCGCAIKNQYLQHQMVIKTVKMERQMGYKVS